MAWPPTDDRLTNLIAQEINPHVDTWKLAMFIAQGVVKSREVQGELQRISAAHTAGQHCGDRNCEACWQSTFTTQSFAEES